MFIVLDLEFNQAYNFADFPVEPNPACRFEIIQIGAVKLDDSFNIVSSFNELIKPQIYPRLHPYVEKITGFTEDSLENHPYFPEVFKRFSEFVGEDKTLVIWGTSDVRALYRNLAYYNLTSEPTLIKYVDAQEMTTRHLKYSKGGTIGLENAVRALELPVEEQFHDAYCDALYTARIFKRVCQGTPPLKIFNSSHIPKASKSK